MKKLSRYFLLLAIIILNAGHICGQEYNITVKAPQLKGDTLRLAYYYGTRTFQKNLSVFDSQGVLHFTGNNLHNGIYILVLNDSTGIELLIENDRNFTVSFGNLFTLEGMTIQPESMSSKYLDFLKNRRQLERQIDTQQRILRAESPASGSSQKTLNTIKTLQDQIQVFTKKVITENPNTLLADYLQMMLPVKPNASSGTEADSLNLRQNLVYFKDHYLDNVNFSDSMLVYTPLLQVKIERYLTLMVPQKPDDVKLAIDHLISISGNSNAMQQFVMNALLNHYYQDINKPVNESAFIYLANKYFLQNTPAWADSSLVNRINAEVLRIQPDALGQPAPSLPLTSLNNQKVQINTTSSKYTLLYFWDAECDVCKKLTPQLYAYYQQNKHKGLKVIAILTDKNHIKEWKAFIEKYNLDWINVYCTAGGRMVEEVYNLAYTPTIYLLNEQHRIIAKDLMINELNNYIK